MIPLLLGVILGWIKILSRSCKVTWSVMNHFCHTLRFVFPKELLLDDYVITDTTQESGNHMIAEECKQQRNSQICDWDEIFYIVLFKVLVMNTIWANKFGNTAIESNKFVDNANNLEMSMDR